MDRALDEGGEVTPPPFEDRAASALRHYRAMIEHYRDGHGTSPEAGIVLGVRMARKHLAAWIDAMPEIPRNIACEAKKVLCTSADPGEVEDGLRQVFDRNALSVAA
jgi:tRNA-dihydrouridine synthase